MYTNVLIPTDGSDLAGRAVQHGISLAKRIGARTTVLTVTAPFHVLTADTQMIEDTRAGYKTRIEEHARKTLGAVADAANAAGVACETIHIEHEHPYRAIIDTAEIEGMRSNCDGLAWAQRTIRSCARQCDRQGSHALQDSGSGLSLNFVTSRPCLLLAQSGHSSVADQCPPSEVKRILF